MNDLNSVFLVGRIVADPDARYADSGKAVLRLRLASHRSRFNEEKKEYTEETGFFDVSLFGRSVERWSSVLRKGQRIGVNGRLCCDTYTARSGEKKTRYGIVAYSLQLLEPPLKTRVAEN